MFDLKKIAAALAVASLVAAPAAQAEGKIRIAEQFGVVYLLLNVAQDQKLIEKHGKKHGVEIDVDWVKLSGGAATNDALLSNSVDVVGAGLGPLMTIWDRTNGKQNVRAIASLGNFPYYLISTNPAVKSIADFGPKDRIALPAVSVSVQARILQMASSKQWGAAQFKKLDANTQALPHPDAAAAVIAGGTEINAHFANPPFQEQELAGNPKAMIVLDSYQVLGGPASSTVLYATEKYVKENPKTYRAFLDALVEAAQLASTNPEAAADAYLRVNKGGIDRALLAGGMNKPDARERARHWLGKVGLAGFAGAYPHTLSGGMKARVAIARALAMQPEVLLMDEPFAALDALTRRTMQEQLHSLWEEIGFTMLFVTHSIEEALVVGNRILLLSPHPGRVRAELNSHQFDLKSAGSLEFQAANERIHRLLFGQAPAQASRPLAVHA